LFFCKSILSPDKIFTIGSEPAEAPRCPDEYESFSFTFAPVILFMKKMDFIIDTKSYCLFKEEEPEKWNPTYRVIFLLKINRQAQWY
jgi:hypothetical protein